MRGTYKYFLAEEERFNKWISETITKILDERRSSPPKDGEKKLYFCKSFMPQHAIDVKELADRWNVSFSELEIIMQDYNFPFDIGWIASQSSRYRRFFLYTSLKAVEDCEDKCPQLKEEAERFEKRNALEKEFIEHKGTVYDALSCFEDVHQNFCNRYTVLDVKGIINCIFRVPEDREEQRKNQVVQPWGLFSRIIQMLKQGKSRPEIACKLRDMGLSRPIIGALLRKDRSIISDYGQYADTLLKAESTEDDTILE